MARGASGGGGTPGAKAAENFFKGLETARDLPLLSPLVRSIAVWRSPNGPYPRQGWATIALDGTLYVHPERQAEPDEWLYVIAHCALHLGFGHFQKRFQQREWDLACECAVYQFLSRLKLGKPPESHLQLPLPGSPELPATSEEGLFRYFCEAGIPSELPAYSLTGTRESDMVESAGRRCGIFPGSRPDWEHLFGSGLSSAVARAIDVVGVAAATTKKRPNTTARRAMDWFIGSYPLLGAIAASFELIEDPEVCTRRDISVAAVNDSLKEIYLQPRACLSDDELRFVIAHELLHASLRHSSRSRGRDHFLWNVACDFVINGWLIEMGVGAPPRIGVLHDTEFNGLSAESVYDRIVTDLRRFRRLGTFRGAGIGDILDPPSPGWWATREGISLDEFYRNCLGQGLLYHHQQCRGLLPAGLEEEIRALVQPPIPWDVELARWLDDRFNPLEQRRTYARPSRRQSATPDIPRPRYQPQAALLEGRTFGVVLDTSGSMDRRLLGESLGAIASYCESRDVFQARVVFCDATAYDAGYLGPSEIAGRVTVRGRGGTILQPGIDLLEKAPDFPKDGPILIITDGFCDHFQTSREHAILLPEGRSLHFTPQGKVFRMS